jgi:predicted TIM-barrel fold metal-dependent hydrolase
MKKGYKVIDIDTHVNPSYDTLAKFVDPSFRPRLDEMKPYIRTVGTYNALSIASIPFDRFPGEAPKTDDAAAVVGGRGALEGRVTKNSGHHRVDPQHGVSDENAEGRLSDMDMEGRDIDVIIPGTWPNGLTHIDDVTLAEGMYSAYHRYMKEYCSTDPTRLKSLILAPAADIEWAVSEVKSLANENWVAAVAPLLPEGMPVDHPALDPLWEVMNDAHLPILHHSFTFEPPYFPGYRDMWDNVAVARTAAHPWGAARLLSYLIVGRIFDRFPNINCGAAEVGHGWLPHWLIRLEEMCSYVSGTTPKTDYKPIEYAQMGCFRCGAEPFEGAAMTKAVIDLLGTDALMHQSDYPHGEAHFPDTAEMVIDWPFWKDLGGDALEKHMAGNAEKFLRLA